MDTELARELVETVLDAYDCRPQLRATVIGILTKYMSGQWSDEIVLRNRLSRLRLSLQREYDDLAIGI